MEKKIINSKNRAKKETVKDGNTGQPSQCYRWCFTLNNYTKEDVLHLKMRLNDKCKWWIFGEEVGKKTETPHLQGAISLVTKLRRTALSKWDRRVIWSRMRNEECAYDYCKKEMGILHTNMDVDEYGEYDGVKWKPWQEEVVKAIEKPCADDRKINWIWDEEGNIGKSYLTKYLIRVENALVVEGKKGDIFHQIAKRKIEGIRTNIVVIDVPRSSYGNISYSAIECIKNGFISSGKYEGGQYTFKPPHIYIFANNEPDYTKFSMDRWNVKEITMPPAVGDPQSPCSVVRAADRPPILGVDGWVRA